MIKIETVLDILKKDGLFREIIDQGHYHYNYSHVVFDTICYDSRKAKEKSLFFVKGAAFKKEFLISAISQGLGWYSSPSLEPKVKQQQPISPITFYLQGIDLLCSRPWTQP